MTLKSIISFLIITLLLAACGYPMPTMVPTVTDNPTVAPTTSATTSPPVSYPSPVSVTAVPTTSIYPAPVTPGTGASVIPPSGYEPQPGDDSLKRDQASLDLANSQLIVIATDPAQPKAVLAGSLPDPCHYLRVVVKPPDVTNTINIEVYTLVDANTICITVIKPFIASIPLGSYSSGQYTVMVNSEKLGQFVTTFAPQPGDANLTRGDVSLDMSLTKLATTGGTQNIPAVDLQGSLPDPCHQLRIVLTPADNQNKISLDVYSVYDSKTTCTTAIQPFQVIYPLGSGSGQSTTYVNGQYVGKFDWGG